ncbi:MAG: hypothetical protein QOE26_557 [Verrucomicrobiota bacterium]
MNKRTIICSIGQLIAAAAVYWHLIKGGWLTNHYQLNDPNIVNLALAIFEPIAVLSVIAFWIWRTSSLRQLMLILGVIQILIVAGFLLFFLLFALTWHPKMM